MKPGLDKRIEHIGDTEFKIISQRVLAFLLSFVSCFVSVRTNIWSKKIDMRKEEFLNNCSCGFEGDA